MVGIIYGSSMGNTEEVANSIAEILNGKGVENEVLNVANLDPKSLSKFDSLVVGSSTWGCGDLQDDWDGFDFSSIDVSGKKVALFGLGDSQGYSDTFCDAMGILYDKFSEKDAVMIGEVSGDGYEFDESAAFRDGKFVGLALDNDNQSELSEDRVKSWLDSLSL